MFNNLKNLLNFKFNVPEEKVRDTVLIFLLFIWFVNPTNKLILLFFLILLCVLTYITKKFDISIILVFFLSSFFLVGKKYFIQLNDLAQFPHLIQFYPIGLVAKTQISVSDVLFAFLVVYLIIMYHRKQISLNKVTFIDISLIIFFFYGIFADILASSNLYVSLILKKDLFEYIFLYFVIKLIIKDQSFLIKSFLAILISLTMFEIFVCFQQLIHSSPVGKVFEASSGIEPFGQGLDELYFIFRPLGTFIHVNKFAMFLVAVLPFFVYLIKKSKEHILKIIFFLALISLTFTLSRAAWLSSLISLLIILLYFGFRKKNIFIQSLPLKKVVFLLLLILSLFIYSMPRIVKISNIFQEGGGVELRIRQTNEVISLIYQSPLFGTGKEMSVIKALEKNPKGVFASFPSEIHNYYLLLAVENGLPYLGLFFIFLFFTLKRLINYKKDLPFISFVSLLSMIIIGLFQPFLINQLLFILSAFNYDRIS